MRAATF
ncbi:hypothetical protein BC938DRAFT_475681 [Jimgerdemannia flammicorona]|nr:hypothetical protein BC938DRAFT_475681 [Jimgerdemannia flammicorona]